MKYLYLAAPYAPTAEEFAAIRKGKTAVEECLCDASNLEERIRGSGFAARDLEKLVERASEALKQKSPGKWFEQKARRCIEERNTDDAEKAGLRLAKAHKTPVFVPHGAMRHWEENGVEKAEVLDHCLAWLKKCDCLFVYGSQEAIDHSNGIGQERTFARASEIPEVRWVPDEPPPEIPGLEARSEHVLKYEVCAETYRHTYQTIWQAGTVLIAASAAILAYAEKNPGPSAAAWYAGIPFMFWFWGVFVPMDRYGHLRWTHLEELEKRLGLRHFTHLRTDHRLWFQVHNWVFVAAFCVMSVYLWGLTHWIPSVHGWLGKCPGGVSVPFGALVVLLLVIFVRLWRSLEATRPTDSSG